jgi:hypothetical protein
MDREDALPVDAHQLLSLFAPRHLYVCSATEAFWGDPGEEFLAAHLGGPVCALWGHRGLGSVSMPKPDTVVRESATAFAPDRAPSSKPIGCTTATPAAASKKTH